MPLLDIEVYTSVKEEADKVSAIMSDLIDGKITAQAAEKLLGAKYSSFARKKLNKSAWTVSKVVQPLQNTLVYNHDLMDHLGETAFGSFCQLVFGSELTELSDGFFSAFLPFLNTVVKSVDETEQKWFEKYFKGSTWLTAKNTGEFLTAVSCTQEVSKTRKEFVRKSIATIIKNVSKTWYISRGVLYRYLDYPDVSERLLFEGQVLSEVEGIISYTPMKKGSRIEPCLTIDLFNSKIRRILNRKHILYVEDLKDFTEIGVKSFEGLGISSFWKIEDVMNNLEYPFKVVEV